MADVTVTRYGPGGYDPDAADGNVESESTVTVPDWQVEAQEAASKLADYRARGWATLTASERAEVARLLFLAEVTPR